MARDSDLFETALVIAGDRLGQAPLTALTASSTYPMLRAQAEAATKGDDAGWRAASGALDVLLPRIGLLLDAPGARVILEQLGAWGLSPAEPRLDMLHFNAALTPENAP